MSLRTEQIYVRIAIAKQRVDGLRACALSCGRRFSPHPRYRLDGVEQVLRISVRDKRRFLVLPTRTDWTCVWELVEHVDFADPGLVACLSRTLHASALWLTLNEDYNIWAYQIFEDGNLSEEQFLPEDYFLGKGEGGDLDSYGSCRRLADEFQRRMKLPHFLMPVGSIDKDSKVKNSVIRVSAPIRKRK